MSMPMSISATRPAPSAYQITPRNTQRLLYDAVDAVDADDSKQPILLYAEFAVEMALFDVTALSRFGIEDVAAMLCGIGRLEVCQ